jgi:hypothetical protein
MKDVQLKSGDQVRELCSDFNGRRFLAKYGYVVEYVDDDTVSILWTHDALGYSQIPGHSRTHISNLWKTGEKFKVSDN